jgi:dihydrofolate synthase / folylpolyglutamate synthase
LDRIVIYRVPQLYAQTPKKQTRLATLRRLQKNVLMDFREAENYLYSLGNEVETMKLGLDNITALLSALGEPQQNYLKVQVAGTNGKGSVCAFLDSICREAGVKTGLFTSPHLISIRERIKIAGEEVSEEEFARLASAVRQTSESMLATGTLERMPTFFEQITGIALLAFAEAKVELAILETGLGGRFDATTAANAEIAAITRIDLDHQEYLGDTIEQIAAEKAGIIVPCTKAVVIGRQDERAMKVLLERCVGVGVVPRTHCEPFVWAVDSTKYSVVADYQTNRGTYWDSSLGLAGRHQIENSCVAVLLAECLARDFEMPITEEHIWEGLEEAKHPGRLEFVGRRFLLDGAHNPGGAKALAEFLEEFVTRPVTLVFGAMREKDVSQTAKILFPKAELVILTQPANSRALSAKEIVASVPDDLFRVAPTLTGSVAEAIEAAQRLSAEEALILVTGSLYLVGEAKKILAENDVAESQI